MMLLFMSGCGSSALRDINDIEDNSSENMESEKNKNDDSELADNDSGIFDSVPDWLEKLSALKEDEKKLYFKGNGKEFCFEGEKVTIPECNIIMAAKEIAGYELEGIEIQNDIIDILYSIEDSKIINEQEVEKQNWLGISYYIVFLSTDARYYLMDIDISDQGFLHITITDDDKFESFFVKSSKLCRIIKKSSQYKMFDTKNSFKINRIEVVKNEKHKYELSTEELKKFKSILSNLNDYTDSCSGPFDVDFKAETDKDTIHIKWCNDDCRIIAVEGRYYRVTERDAQWILDLIKKDN